MLASKSPLLIIHLIGLALAIGSVVALDLRLMSLLTGRKINPTDAAVIAALSPFARIGLALLWLSGVGFLANYYIYDPQLLSNPKLHAKIAIVSALTLNGIFIEKFAIRHVVGSQGFALFDRLSTNRQIVLIGIASISAVSWYVPIVLGAVRELNFTVSATVLLEGYVVLLIIATFGMMILKALLYHTHQSHEWRYASLLDDYHAKLS